MHSKLSIFLQIALACIGPTAERRIPTDFIVYSHSFRKMACHSSYIPDYFAINDILSSEERISCKLEVDLPGLGFLISSSQSPDLNTGAEVEFPLWLAEQLKRLQKPAVSVDLPKIFKDGYREILEADADHIVLSKWSPFFYELGMHVRKFNDRECEQITDCLIQTFKSRFRFIMEWSQDPLTDPAFCNQLPRLERDLFASGRRAEARLLEWLRMGTNSILPSEISANMRKRKRINYELD